uniref:Endoplasmic reticulum oxidoreductin 1 n=1 Tax=Calcidiscus leptoporus TaxID=127549 RepID=A0A7S0J7G0_9EUKA|mmetsp:Transcript_4295/g.9739  ORF Transcript_4295/g.9739 Transcript_4295/m.9739 type:complete len:487 (+) Transcript_4295:84-1544(+)
MRACVLGATLLALGEATSAIHRAAWHEGCLCELKPNAAAARSDFAMPAIFGTRFFRQQGRVSEFCPCSLETVQRLNSELIAPRLLPLLNRTFFRYFRANLDGECPFWNDTLGKCRLRDCVVDECTADEEERLAACEEEQALGAAPTMESRAEGDEVVYAWTGDAASEGGSGASHYDLAENREQFTGYASADGASRVWGELHAHNSFAPAGCAAPFAPRDLESMPVEHRLFHKLASGMHASVSSHIAANYLLDARTQVWGLELDEYNRRVGAHPERLLNLHFSFLLVLRAVEVASATLAHDFVFASGSSREGAATGRAVRELLASQPEWPLTFDEQAAFAGVRAEGEACCASLPPGSCCAEEVGRRSELLGQFRSRLQNITRLMDCVGCQRCRLWGKLQVHGLSTALRLLYEPRRDVVLQSLRRGDVVALFNLLGRLSHSVEVARLVVPLLQHADCAGCKATAFLAETEEEEATAGGTYSEPWQLFS